MIILTQAQADVVRGKGLNNSQLQPIMINDSYCLPESVLNDPDYIEWRDFLSALPVGDVVVPDE